MSGWTPNPRHLTEAETRSLTCLLQPPVPAAAALRLQAETSSVIGGCESTDHPIVNEDLVATEPVTPPGRKTTDHYESHTRIIGLRPVELDA